MRTFIAIELPAQIKTALFKLQEQLKQSDADVKWVEPQNIHLTLKFLGEVDEEKLGEIKQAIEDIALNKTAFGASIASLGVFPKANFPRVIWVGIDRGDSEAKEIAKELEEKIQKLGIPKEERTFSSHITIGRVRSVKNKEKLIQLLNKLGENLVADNLEFYANKITLFKSILNSKGPAYEALEEISLKAT